ncbi:DUF3488 and transglutaminase-like domain-containing protein [Microbacterium sp. Marseille-Q6965]|uniref:transglutaminase family protein n=1 Tax=Microbacterium sp. Marseille-Q6965 TaxID=2965072 RepID=UPI0021B76468|nr:DUF3488 and transglutaminase-like domain-containing protein [Microbacterium sp. Marseille-Q6965]
MAIDELIATSPAPPLPARPARRRRDRGLATSVATLLLALAAILPLADVIVPAWLAGAVLCMLAVWATGAIVRAVVPLALFAPLAQAAAWVAATTGAHSLLSLAGLLPGPSSLLGVVPTPRLLAGMPPLLSSATTQITESAAPVDPDAPLTFVLIAAAGLLVLVLDVFAVTLRLPVAAIVAAVAVWILPPAITGIPTGLPPLLLFLAATLVLLYLDRRRRTPTDARPVTAAALAAAALAASLVVAPLLPEPTGSLRGPGAPTRIDASLDLGDDLRRVGDTDVLRYVVNAGEAPPYLRVATLSSFTGAEWEPDDGPSQPVEDVVPSALEADAPEGSELVSVDVEILNLEGSLLPVPYPLAALDGVSREWRLTDENGTLTGGEAGGESYTATALVPQPTRERAQAATAAIPSPSAEGLSRETTALPAAPLVDPVAEAANRVVAGETNDYDRLVALQSWFRAGEFEYSLDAPVDDGFDGTDLEAMAAFLEEREGYCVHFASTFAVMARTLGMPSRVVVGYLPGVRTGEWLGQDAVYTVRASQLHAWPEVYFRGIGWMPFEPTPGLGTATSLLPEAIAGGGSGAQPTPAAPPVPTPTASAERTLPPEELPSGAEDDRADEGAAWLVPLGWGVGLLALLSLPAVARITIRRRRLRAAVRGDAPAAWRELTDILVDAGEQVHAHETPRALAARVARRPGLSPELLEPLVAGIEAASYGPARRRHAPDLADSLRAVRGALLPFPLARAVATAAPRSFLSPRAVAEVMRFGRAGRAG